MEYVVVSEQGFEWIGFRYQEANVNDIQTAVNFLLSKGWELSGGVSSIGVAHKAYIIQAMTLDEEPCRGNQEYQQQEKDVLK